MKKILMAALAAALCLLPVARLTAADDAPKMQPVVVVSLASYDELFHDIEFIGTISDNPDLLRTLAVMVRIPDGDAGRVRSRGCIVDQVDMAAVPDGESCVVRINDGQIGNADV